MSIDTKAPKMLAHLRASNEVSKRFQDHLEKDAADSEAVKSAVPAAIAALMGNERIFDQQKEAVAEKIASSHVACIELIRDLSKHRNAGELDSIGTAVGQEKSAAARPITGAAIADFDETDSGKAFSDKLLGRS